MLKKELAKAGIRYQRPEGVNIQRVGARDEKSPDRAGRVRAGVSAYENLKIDDFFL